MPVSRRGLLLQGAALAIITTTGTGSRSVFAQDGLPVRRSLGELRLDDPIIEAYREGVRLMRELPQSNPLSWTAQAAIHGTSSGFNLCPHGNWYFLPWHRAFILTYEQIVRELTGYREFALPYWDWTTDRQMPAAFVSETWNGMPNALYEPSRRMRPTDSIPDSVVGPDVMRSIYAEEIFENFGTSRAQRPSPQSSDDPSWIKNGTGIQGTLERNPHNTVHGIVGGYMGGSQSALDPIFMMHHCNIDRIWAVWNSLGRRDSNDPLWLQMPFTDNFVNPDGTSWSPVVTDMLDYQALGYSYGLSDEIALLQETPLVTSMKLNALLGGERAADVILLSAENTVAATRESPLGVSIEVSPALTAAVAAAPRQPSGISVFSLRSLAPAPASPRAIAFIRDIAAENPEQTQFRVFLNCEYLSEHTPTTDNHYVGSFSLFGEHGDHGGHGDDLRPSVMLDLSETIDRLYGSAVEIPGALTVQIQPVGNVGDVEQVGSAVPGSVEIAFIPA